MAHPPPAILFSAGLHRLILDLYEGGRVVSLTRYRAWALRESQRELGFTRAFWGSGSRGTDRVHTLQALDAGREDATASRAAGALSDWLGSDWAEHRDDDSAWTCSNALSREGGALVYCEADSKSGLIDFITFAREPAAPAFTASERVRVGQLAQHLLAAWRHCRSLNLVMQAAASNASAAALVDRHGGVQEANGPFYSLLRSEYPRAAGSRVPADLLEVVAAGGQATIGAVDWQARKVGDLTLLAGRSLGAMAKLTGRERAIVGTILSGRSYAQSAATLAISVHTLRNTLARIYRKLGVSNKMELAQREGSVGGTLRES